MARKIRKGCSAEKKKEVGLAKSSPEYVAVLTCMQQIIRAIEADDHAKEHLCREFQMAEWLDVNVRDISAGDLVRKALSMIEISCSNYEKFYTMLNNIVGLKQLRLQSPLEGIYTTIMIIFFFFILTK